MVNPAFASMIFLWLSLHVRASDSQWCLDIQESLTLLTLMYFHEPKVNETYKTMHMCILLRQ